MRSYKIVTATIALVLLSSQFLFAQEQKNGLTWYNDITQAYQLSKQTQKPIFAFFTGSDWCGWCHKMVNNVFDKPQFQAWAKQNVILLELDFPRNKKLPDNLAQQNGSLQQAFKVQGFPTVWIFNMSKDSVNKFNISPLGNIGYPQSEPGKEEITFLENVKKIVAPKTTKLN